MSAGGRSRLQAPDGPADVDPDSDATRAAARRPEQDPLASQRPGSSKQKDALVGGISDKSAKRLPKKRLLTYRLVLRLIFPIIRWVLKVEATGAEKIPKKGPILIASNHCSWFDPIVLVSRLGRPLSALAKSYLFKGWFRRWFFEYLAGQIRVDRERRGNLAAVEAATEALAYGRCIGIWPEGGRSPTGHLTRGKTGIARIALASGAPVYPVAVLGTFELKSKYSKKIKWGTPLKVVFGDPMTFPDLIGQQDDRAVTREVTDRIMLEIAKLMGPDEEARYRELLRQDVAPGELPLDKVE